MKTSHLDRAEWDMTRNAPSSRYRIVVIELDDVVPRRNPKLPNLYVGLTTREPEDKFSAVLRKPSPSWLEGHIKTLRTDLCSWLTTSDLAVAKEALSAVISILKAQGFTVNRSTSVWTVYVIELDNNDVPNGEKGYFYVGETSKTPEVRFQEHRNNSVGGKNGRTRLASRVVFKRGKRLRMDLAPKEIYFSSAASKAAEAAWAEKLRKKGFLVEGGH